MITTYSEIHSALKTDALSPTHLEVGMISFAIRPGSL